MSYFQIILKYDLWAHTPERHRESGKSITHIEVVHARETWLQRIMY
jgi:hypothetical protein